MDLIVLLGATVIAVAVVNIVFRKAVPGNASCLRRVDHPPQT